MLSFERRIIMKKSLIFAVMLGMTTSVYAANPFVDVPKGHWAYDSIAQLANAGVVDGLEDGLFAGEKIMTRYEMAQIVAKALAKGANCDKLAAEFADELDGMGVRVAKLEKKVDNVKITGNIRYSYRENTEGDLLKQGRDDKGYNRFRSRIMINGRMNDDWTYTGMLENDRYLDTDLGTDEVKLKRAFVNGRLGGIKVTAGRVYALQEDMIDANADGIMASYRFGKINLLGWVLKNCENFGNVIMDDHDRLYMAKAEGEFDKLGVFAQYWKVEDELLYEGQKTYEIGINYAFTDKFKVGANYYNGTNDFVDEVDYDKNGWQVSVDYRGAKAAQPGSWGLWARYMDRPMGTYLKPATLYTYAYSDVYDIFWSIFADGYKGFEFGGNYTFAKNIIGTVRYYELEGREKSILLGNKKGKCNTLWGDITFMF